MDSWVGVVVDVVAVVVAVVMVTVTGLDVTIRPRLFAIGVEVDAKRWRFQRDDSLQTVVGERPVSLW